MNSNQDANWMHLPLSSKEGYISLARKLPIVHSGNTQGLLVIQVKMEPFQDYFPSQKYQSSFILDKNNSILMRDKESTKDGQVNSDSALQRIIESDSSSGGFMKKIEMAIMRYIIMIGHPLWGESTYLSYQNMQFLSK